MKSHFTLALLICFLLGTLILPISAGDPPALTLTQADTAQPGQPVVLTLSISNTQLAGGFLTLEYDATLFTLTELSLLQASDKLTLTYKDNGGKINVLLDAAQNVQIDGALLSLTLASSEEAQPGTYTLRCTVPDAASFYALAEDGSTYPLSVNDCQGVLTLTEPVLPTCPARYLACQETNAKDGSFYLRICALVDPTATLSRGSYGFVIAVTDQDGTRELTLGGSQLLSELEGGGKTYTADQLGGLFYTAALSLPATGEVTVTLSPYVRIDSQTLYAGSYTLHYADGVYMGTSH